MEGKLPLYQLNPYFKISPGTDYAGTADNEPQDDEEKEGEEDVDVDVLDAANTF